MRKYMAAGLFTAIHDISDGGMLVALAEMATTSGIGATICLPTSGDDKIGRTERCFGEGQSSYLETIAPGVFDGSVSTGVKAFLNF